MNPGTKRGVGSEKLVLADEKVQAALAGKSVRKLVVVPGRIVNIVAT
jgi:leucyl-tRNA synthetase